LKDRKFIAAAVLLSLVVSVGIGASFGEAFSLVASPPRGVSVSFPGDPGFAELVQDFTGRTGLEPGAGLAEEFESHTPIGRMESSTGLAGTFFEDALLLPALALGRVSYVIYGTIAIPEGAALAGRSFSGDYGMVVYGVPLVIVLVERGSGELAAFVVTSSSALFYPPTFAMELLFRLITITPSYPPPLPRPPSAGLYFHLSFNCQDLPLQQEIDVAVGSGETLVEVSGSFAVEEAGLGALAISSFGPALLSLVTAPNYLNLSFVPPKGEQKLAIPLDRRFTLLVQAGEEKRACVEAEVKPEGGGYHIVGTAYHN